MSQKVIKGQKYVVVPGQLALILKADDGHSDDVLAVYTPITGDKAYLEWTMSLADAIQQNYVTETQASIISRFSSYTREETFQYFGIADPMLI